MPPMNGQYNLRNIVEGVVIAAGLVSFAPFILGYRGHVATVFALIALALLVALTMVRMRRVAAEKRALEEAPSQPESPMPGYPMPEQHPPAPVVLGNQVSFVSLMMLFFAVFSIGLTVDGCLRNGALDWRMLLVAIILTPLAISHAIYEKRLWRVVAGWLRLRSDGDER